MTLCSRHHDASQHPFVPTLRWDKTLPTSFPPFPRNLIDGIAFTQPATLRHSFRFKIDNCRVECLPRCPFATRFTITRTRRSERRPIRHLPLNPAAVKWFCMWTNNFGRAIEMVCSDATHPKCEFWTGVVLRDRAAGSAMSHGHE